MRRMRLRKIENIGLKEEMRGKSLSFFNTRWPTKYKMSSVSKGTIIISGYS